MDKERKFSIVKKAIDNADPHDLLKHGAPSDEFDGESKEISERVSASDSVESIAEVAAEVFSRCFYGEFTAEHFFAAAEVIKRELSGH